jgi:hypothetical protein
MQLAHSKTTEYHRLYGELSAAQQRLSIAGRCGASDEKVRASLQVQVSRLQRQSDDAMRALRAAFPPNATN